MNSNQRDESQRAADDISSTAGPTEQNAGDVSGGAGDTASGTTSSTTSGTTTGRSASPGGPTAGTTGTGIAADETGYGESGSLPDTASAPIVRNDS